MKKFVMPKFEMVGLTADVAFAGASSKGGSFEFAGDKPNTIFNANGNKFSRATQLAFATEQEITQITQAS